MPTARDQLPDLLQKVVTGETVDIGVFKVRENYLYTGQKHPDGSPILRRVVSMVYFDEDDDDNPATEDFDGTLDSFTTALEAHAAFEMDDLEVDDETA